MKKVLSIVVSCYNEEDALPLFYRETKKYLKKINEIDYEFIFVNDGSKDDTLNVIKKLRNKDKRVKYLNFSSATSEMELIARKTIFSLEGVEGFNHGHYARYQGAQHG